MYIIYLKSGGYGCSYVGLKKKAVAMHSLTLFAYGHRAIVV
jgi:hypothetical protein